MNILQQQEALKDMSESQLIQEAKRPSGSVPSYMVLSELNRRKDMRQRYQLNQTKPTATVAEEVITQTEQGLGSMMPRRQPQQMAARPQMPMQQSAIAQNQPMRMRGGGPTGRLVTPEFEEYLRRREDDRKDEIIRGMKELNSARRNRAMMLDDEGSVERMPAPYDEEEAMMRRNQEQAEYAQKLSRSLMGMRNPIGYGVSTGIGALVDMYRNKADETEMYASGGVIRAQAGLFADPEEDRKQEEEFRKKNQEELESLTDDQLLAAQVAASDSTGPTADEVRKRLFGEEVRREAIRSDIMASNAQANKERRESLEGFIEDPLGKIGDALAGNPNLKAPSLRETSLARERLKAEKAEALARGMEEGRLGSTDPTPQQTQAEAEETIEQILATDPSLEQDTPMVQPYPGAPTMIAGQRAPNFRTEVPAVFDDADVPTMSVPDELVADIDVQVPDPDPIDEAQLYADAFADDPAPVTKTQTSGGISGLPLPLLLEAARFGADLADRGTRGENFLGSVAGAGKTSIDRGLKFAERLMNQQRLQNIANVKNQRERENIVFREQVKSLFKDPDNPTVSELNTVVTSLNDQLLNPELDELEKDRIRAQIANLRRMMQSRVGLAQGPTQNLSTEAQAIIDQRTQPAS